MKEGTANLEQDKTGEYPAEYKSVSPKILAWLSVLIIAVLLTAWLLLNDFQVDLPNFSSEDIDDVAEMHTAGVSVALISEDSVYIGVIPEKLTTAQLGDVKKLNLNGKEIRVVPDWWLTMFTKLSVLDLHGVGLGNSEVLKLTKLTNLEELNLSDNSLFSQADDTLNTLWTALPKLRKLKLANVGGNVTNFGDLSPLTSLEELDLSHNKITDIKPLSLGALSHLRQLNLAHNQLASFSLKDIPMNSIEELNLQHTGIRHLLFEGKLAKLRRLDLSENSKVAIDEAYGSLFVVYKIEELNIDDDAQVPDALRKKLDDKNGRVMAGRYRNNGDGTVADIQTKLQWLQCCLGQKFSGSSSVPTRFQCEGEIAKYISQQKVLEATTAFNAAGGYSGYNDWRVPTREELKTLVYCSSQAKTWNNNGHKCKGDYFQPTIMKDVFPQTPASWFWTASLANDYTDQAWLVNFANGLNDTGIKIDYYFVRLVRGGK